MKWIKLILLLVMAAFYVFGGVNHFRNPDFYLAIMPPYVPAHEAMVALSGVAEIVLGVLVVVPFTRRWAAWGIIAMLIAFLPVHIHMLVNNHLFPDVSTAFLWARFPLQALLILWAWWYTLPSAAGSTGVET
ncbi:MAG: DoxX family membrane protein [Thermoanaerobaculia bacterium]|nr:DoxX family membrane protein [Thermoanaerobaculia bacterium]